MRQIELLSPAGDVAILKAVIHAGADAVYVGGPSFGARAYAHNFSKEELLASIDYAHLHGRKVYLTVNTLLKEREVTERLYDYLLPYYEQGLDAVIVQDFGVFTFLREAFPGLSLHASTQMTVTGADGAAFLQSKGASRIVTARELSFAEIRKIKEETGVEIESFVHGALCYCYSGQCLFSSMLGGRSGNRGRCAQPCRLAYEVFDGQKSLTKEAKYILSPKDLCTASMIPKLIECGIDSFKIEGRMKQAEYAAGVTSLYREYLDRYEQYGKEAFFLEKEDEKKLLDLGNRSGFTKGYYEKHNGADMITMSKPNHAKADEALHEEIRKKYIQKDLQEKIKGNLTLFPEKNATLSVSFGEIHAKAHSGIVQTAKKKPLDRETVLEKIEKTGNTPFVFEEVNLSMDENSFLPVGQLNALRRDALMALEKEMLKPYRRDGKNTKKPKTDVSLRRKEKAGQELSEEPFLAVSLEKTELFDTICEKSYVKRICLESDSFWREGRTKELVKTIKKAQECEKEILLSLPYIFREPTRKRYEESYSFLEELGLDGFLIRNYEELGFLQRHGYKGIVVSDHNLYTYSGWTKEAFLEEGVTEDTLPLELNLRELRERSCTESQMLLYGYIPLMVTAGCLHKTLGKCEKKEEIYRLKDRYGKMFAVKNCCENCYNLIYNSAPLALFGMREEIERLNAASYRLHFSMESREEAEKILALYESVYIKKENWDKNSLEEYTNGHMKRGVE